MPQKTSMSPIPLLPQQLNINNADEVLQQLVQTSNNDDYNVDLSIIKHCDSAGIAALIETKAVLLKQHRNIHYINPSQQLIELATFLKVQQLLFGY